MIVRKLTGNTARKLDGYSSIILDALRLFCALTVVLGHCRQILNPALPLEGGIFALGHGAVVVFFVISGYVIAHTTSVKKRSFNTYLVARFSRLYSIYLPALALTAICAALSFIFNKAIYFQYDRANNIVRYLLTLLFCNENWFLSAAPPMNGPFWSLSFEFWYYMLFAAFFYGSGKGRKLMFALLISVFIGPKILVMFPIWFLGWLAYKAQPLKIQPFTARIISLTFILLAFTLIIILPAYPAEVGFKPLYMANGFISDFTAGLFIAVSFWILPTNNESKIRDTKLVTRFRFYANLTYPIYLFHFPLLVVCACIFYPLHLSDKTSYFAGLCCTLFICVVSGAYFDSKKKNWDNLFRKIIYRKE